MSSKPWPDATDDEPPPLRVPGTGKSRLDVTEIFRGKNILLIGTTGFVGKVIVAGAENAHVPAMLGWDRAESLTEAIAMAKSFVGPSPEITLMHHPPIVMADME